MDKLKNDELDSIDFSTAKSTDARKFIKYFGLPEDGGKYNIAQRVNNKLPVLTEILPEDLAPDIIALVVDWLNEVSSSGCSIYRNVDSAIKEFAATRLAADLAREGSDDVINGLVSTGLVSGTAEEVTQLVAQGVSIQR